MTKKVEQNSIIQHWKIIEFSDFLIFISSLFYLINFQEMEYNMSTEFLVY